MDKKYYWIFGILLLISLILIGYNQNSKLNSQIPEQKYCNTDSDCTIKYNVKFNGQCSAGCFNSDTIVDEWCNQNNRYESFPPGTTCTCINHECQKSS